MTNSKTARITALLAVALAATRLGVADTELPLPAKDDWRYLSFEKKHEQMTFVVHPAMMRRFQTFYETQAPELTCVSCHGENPEKAGYDMANSALIALSAEKVRALYVERAEVTDEQAFMRDSITPTMARLLGVAAYDPETGLGFSCFGCHRRE